MISLAAVTDLSMWNLLIAIGGVGAAISTAVIAWRKFRPEATNLIITNADTLVEMAVQASSLVKEQRDEIKGDLAKLQRDCAETAQKVITLTSQLAAERESKEEVMRENGALRRRLDILTDEVARLKADARRHFPED